MTNYYGEMPPLVDRWAHCSIRRAMGRPATVVSNQIFVLPVRDCSVPDRRYSPTGWSRWGRQLYVDDGMHYLYNGTSFAGVVAGVAALYLQKHPDADYAEIKNAIITQAKQDTFTGDALPNNSWGYGKVDASEHWPDHRAAVPMITASRPQDWKYWMFGPPSVKIDWDIIPNATGYSLSYRKIGAPYLKAKIIIHHQPSAD